MRGEKLRTPDRGSFLRVAVGETDVANQYLGRTQMGEEKAQ